MTTLSEIRSEAGRKGANRLRELIASGQQEAKRSHKAKTQHEVEMETVGARGEGTARAVFIFRKAADELALTRDNQSARAIREKHSKEGRRLARFILLHAPAGVVDVLRAIFPNHEACRELLWRQKNIPEEGAP